MKKAIIDPGHCVGEVNGGPTGYLEVEGMWILSNYLKIELEKRGIKADLTKKVRTDCPSLAQRGAMAKGADLFISNHSNGFDGTVRGASVFYSVKRPKDKAHAAALSAATSKLIGNPNRGAKTRLYPNTTNLDYYGVIRAAAATGCPHIFMAESEFHDNPIGEAWLKKDSNMRKLAEVQAIEICKILGVSSDVKPEPKPEPKPNPEKEETKTVHRVMAGSFENRSYAERMAKDINDLGYKTYIMTEVIGVKPKVMRVGSEVKVKANAKTYTGGNLSSWVYKKIFDVLQINGERIVIGLNGQITAAINKKDLILQ